MLSFSYPWLFLLLPLPLLIHFLAPAYREPRTAVRVPFMEVLHRLTGSKAGQGAAMVGRSRMQKTQLLVGWLALVTALARPVWMDEPLVRE